MSREQWGTPRLSIEATSEYERSRTLLQQIVRYAFSLSLITLLARIAGFAEEQVLAAKFGASSEVDAYLTALRAPSMLFFVASGIVTPVLLPLIVRGLETGNPKANSRLLTTWGYFLFGACMLTAMVGVLISPYLARLLAPGFDPSTMNRCSWMMRVLFLSSPVLGLLPLFTTFLSANRHFVVPVAAEGISKFAFILSLLLFAPAIDIGAAIVGAIAGTVLQLGINVGWTFRTGVRVTRPEFGSLEFRQGMWLALAPALGMVFSQVGGMLENAFSSTLGQGAVTSLALAQKVLNLPLLLISATIGTVMYTYFSEGFARKSDESFYLLQFGIRFMLFLFIPIAVLTAVLAYPIVAVVFERGKFDSDATTRVSETLVWLSPGLICYSIETLLIRYFFAMSRVWIPIVIGILCVFLKAGLILYLVDTMGLIGVALAIVLSRFVKLVLLVGATARYHHTAKLRAIVGDIVRIVLAVIPASLVTISANLWLAQLVGTSLSGRMLLLLVCGLAGMTTYTFIAWRSGFTELQVLAQLLAARRKTVR